MSVLDDLLCLCPPPAIFLFYQSPKNHIIFGRQSKNEFAPKSLQLPT